LKFKVLLLCVIIMCFSLAGCASNGSKHQSSTPPQLTELAQKELAWLKDVQSIANQINNFYSEWEKGKISREQLAEKLTPLYTQIKGIRDQYSAYRAETKFSQDVIDNPIYSDGLRYGDSLRLNLQAFILEAIKGYPSSEGIIVKSNPNDDEKLKNFYNSEMEAGFTRKLDKLQSALDKCRK